MDEPRARDCSLEQAGRFLDAVAVNWTRERKCATCHTNVPYLMARPVLEGGAEAQELVRRFFEGRVAGWDSGRRGERPRSPAEVVVTAAALAVHDARTTGKLHPLTQKALDRMWTLQRADGAWEWDKCRWPPFEHDDYYGATLAALAVGLAPEGYARTTRAQEGLARLRRYFRDHPPPNLHHRTWLLWASVQVDGLLTAGEREKTIEDLLARQRTDGGWSLAALGDWKGFDGRPNDPGAASAGYGTGLVVYVLRQAGLPARHAAMQRGAAWLRANQRASGRWFTRSLNTDRTHYISHAGTAFAVLALKACGEE